MEALPNSEQSGILQRLVARFIAGMRIVGEQLSTADLSPDEGRLRSSVMPASYMNIPDHAPNPNQDQ